MKKTYLAVVRGYPEESGIIEYALSVKLDKIADKDSSEEKEAQSAVTEYKRLGSVELPHAIGKYETTRYSLVKLLPKTGRKHQLRRHMKHISHHILGDTKYGRGEHNKFIREKFDCHRLLLHAHSLKFTHPYRDETVVIKAEVDETFNSIFKNFSWDRIKLE